MAKARHPKRMVFIGTQTSVFFITKKGDNPMRRGTTPTLKLTLDIDLDLLEDIYVTLYQSGIILTKFNDDIEIYPDDKLIKVRLTEKETMSFKPTAVKIQLRATTKSGGSIATDIVTLPMNDILYNEYIT